MGERMRPGVLAISPAAEGPLRQEFSGQKDGCDRSCDEVDFPVDPGSTRTKWTPTEIASSVWGADALAGRIGSYLDVIHIAIV